MCVCGNVFKFVCSEPGINAVWRLLHTSRDYLCVIHGFDYLYACITQTLPSIR